MDDLNKNKLDVNNNSNSCLIIKVNDILNNSSMKRYQRMLNVIYFDINDNEYITSICEILFNLKS